VGFEHSSVASVPLWWDSCSRFKLDALRIHLVSDRRLLYAAAFVRAVATGLIGVLLGLHLARLGLDPVRSGLVIGAGLWGAAAAALAVTLFADRWGRRRTLALLSLAGAAGGAGLAWAGDAAAMAVAAFVGMVNGMGRDRGGALILEQALLPATTDDRGRTRVMAVYTALQDAGHAIGALLAGLPGLMQRLGWMDVPAAFRAAIGLYALLMAAGALAYLPLSLSLAAPVRTKVVLAPGSRRVLTRISALFAVDALGGGFLTSALLSYFFFKRFGASEELVGGLFAGARVLNALSHLAAAGLAKRIGLVNTMVFTHIPSSLLLATVPFAPTFGVASLLFLLREGLVEMDVPTRQSYVMAVVRPEERTIASGVTSLVRMGMWAVAPLVAGPLMAGVAAAAPLWAGAGLKIFYDAALYASFRRLKPPEELGG
jgi:MFS family permease